MESLRKLWRRFGFFLRRDQLDHDLQEEMRLHVELKAGDMTITDKREAGLGPDAARRQAKIEFGNSTWLGEESRAAWGFRTLEEFVQDVRFGVRMLGKSPGFTAAAVIALALGIGANTAIYSVVNAVLLRPLAYADPDRIMLVSETDERGDDEGVAPPNFLDWQAQNHTFSELAAYSATNFALTVHGEPMRVQGAEVSPNMFSLLGVAPAMGRSFTSQEGLAGQQQVAIISHALWQGSLGGDSGIIGRSITLDAKPYIVVGVMPAGFAFPVAEARAEVWSPLVATSDPQLRGAHYLDAVGRLKSGVTAAEAKADLEIIEKRIAREAPKLVSGRVSVGGMRDQLVGKVGPSLLLLLGAVGFVLLIAIANVANLLLARASGRQREIAIRLAVGASRWRLVRQMLTESVLLASIGGVFGVVLARWATQAIVALSPADVPRISETAVDSRVLLFSVALSLLTGVLFGLAPALHSGTPDVNHVLKEGMAKRGGIGPRLLRNGLLVSEIMLTLVLLAGAGLMIRTFARLQAVDPGFDAGKVLVAEVSLPRAKYKDESRQREFFRQLLDRLRVLPGVESVGATTNLPLSGTNMVFMFKIDERPGENRVGSYRAVSPDYFSTLRVPLKRGRWFTDADTATSPPVMVINEALARRFFAGENPIGKRITPSFKQPSREIVGIVGDVRYAGLDKTTSPEMYAPYTQNSWPFMRLVIRAHSDPTALTGAIRAQVLALDPDQPLDKVRTMQQVLSASVAPRRFYMTLLSVFAGLALALAAVGIYGVMVYMVTQRTQEIAIRMALGANPGRVRRMILGHAAGLAAIGVVLGLAGALTLTRLLTALLFSVKATDPATYSMVVAAVMALVLAAAWLPARRATRIDPMVALRYE